MLPALIQTSLQRASERAKIEHWRLEQGKSLVLLLLQLPRSPCIKRGLKTKQSPRHKEHKIYGTLTTMADSQTNDSLTIRGLKCHVHKWNLDPKVTPKALAIVFHGFLAHGAYPTVRYAAEVLAEAGYAVLAVDLPGHGKSEGSRGYVSSAETLVDDGAAIVTFAESLYSNESKCPPVFLVGSSMGGAIALSVAQKLPPTSSIDIKGVVLLAPMLKLNVSSVERTALQFLSFLVPNVGLIPSSATDDTKQYRDPNKLKECAEDILTVSGSHLKVASALSCVDITLNLRKSFSEIKCPFLLMLADEDVVVKNEGSEELFEKSPSTDKTKKHYAALHGLLCEPSPLFDEIKRDILQWVGDRV